MFERWGRRWECIRGTASSIPGGWFYELWDVTDRRGTGRCVLFAYWPTGGSLTIDQYRDDLSAEIVEWFAAEAREAICPIDPPPSDDE